MKRCQKCRRWKAPTAFRRSVTADDGLQSRCAECAAQRIRERPAARPNAPVRRRTSPYVRAALKLIMIRDAIESGETDRALGIIDRTLTDWRVT